MYNETLENLIVVKRSGQRVEFNASKVAIAIKKAYESINDKNEDKIFKTFEKVLSYINENYKDRKTINVEDIQDIIENTLYSQKHYEVHRAFKEYRNKRSLSRKVFSEKQQHKFLKAIGLFEENDFNSQNVKNPYDVIYKFGKIIYSEYTKAYVLDTKSSRGIEEGNIYIHNLDYFSLGIMSNTHLKLDKYYNEEFDVDNFITELINSQKEINGEIGINKIDYLIKLWILKYYKKMFKLNLIRYFKLLGFYEFINIKKIKEIIDKSDDLELNIDKFDAFIFNEHINRALTDAHYYAKEDTLNFLESYIFKIFSSLEKNVDRDVSYTISFGSDLTILGKIINMKLINLLTRHQFNKINFIIKVVSNDQYLVNEIPLVLDNMKKVYLQLVCDEDVEYFSNGCRIYQNTNNSENISTGRMIVSDTSINLARLGLKYKNKSIDSFYEELNNVCELVKNQLCSSFEVIGNKTKENYEVLFTGNIFDDEKLEAGQKIRKVIKNGCLCIGLIGLKECVMCLENDKLKQIKLIDDILDFLNNKCREFSVDTKLNFGIYETIDKNARVNLLKTDKAIYGAIEKITDKKYYDLIDFAYIEDYSKLCKIQDKFSYGKLITFKLLNKTNTKKISDIISIIEKNKIKFVKIVVGKDEN